MTVKSMPISLCSNHSHHHPRSDRVHKRPSNLRLDLIRFEKLDFLDVLAQRPVKFLEDEKPLMPEFGSSDGTQITELTGFHNYLSSISRSFSATESSCSASDGSKVRVAYQGVAGAYSEDAALKTYPMCYTLACDQTESALKAVELSLVDKAILPIESSVGGSIHRNYDLLLRHRLHIVAEVHLVVNHCLLGLPGVRKEKLNRVLSDQYVLDQCEIMLDKLGVIKVKADDTASAAQIVASDGLRDSGAVASSRAAEIYGLDILAERIQDDTHNICRFLILAREPIIPVSQRPHKTTIVFSLEEGTGVLFKALAVFPLKGINLLKIEARPQRERPLRIVDYNNKGTAKYFEYLFFMDFEASVAESRVQSALGKLQEFARYLQVLGCYPIDTTL